MLIVRAVARRDYYNQEIKHALQLVHALVDYGKQVSIGSLKDKRASDIADEILTIGPGA